MDGRNVGYLTTTVLEDVSHVGSGSVGNIRQLEDASVLEDASDIRVIIILPKTVRGRKLAISVQKITRQANARQPKGDV